VDQDDDDEFDGAYISLLRDDEFISAQILYKEEEVDCTKLDQDE